MPPGQLRCILEPCAYPKEPQCLYAVSILRAADSRKLAQPLSYSLLDMPHCCFGLF
jgi:hypothetical protein